MFFVDEVIKVEKITGLLDITVMWCNSNKYSFG